MGVKFVVDENIGRNLVLALRQIDYNIEHITENFPPGTSDEKVLEYIGTKRYVLITKDKGIRRRPNERKLFLKYKVVAIFLSGTSMSIKQTHKQIVDAWDKMEDNAERKLKQDVAGAFQVAPKGGTVKEIPLN